jgi:hypothetical protein
MDISVQHSSKHAHWTTMSQAEKVITILRYLAPSIAHMLPMSTHSFMSIVGIIEIVAGVIVLIRPRIGSLIVGLWLIGIAINLLLAGYYDIAVRDTVMAISAFCLHMLTTRRGLVH